jgi:hypothetical protein
VLSMESCDDELVSVSAGAVLAAIHRWRVVVLPAVVVCEVERESESELSQK